LDAPSRGFFFRSRDVGGWALRFGAVAQRTFRVFEGAALAPLQRRNQTVDLGAFRLPCSRAIRLQASDQNREIARAAGRIADAFDETQISAGVRDERADVFERAAQPSRGGAQVVQRFAVEAALVRAPDPRFKRRDTLVDESGGPGVEYSRGLSPEKVWESSYRAQRA